MFQISSSFFGECLNYENASFFDSYSKKVSKIIEIWISNKNFSSQIENFSYLFLNIFDESDRTAPM